MIVLQSLHVWNWRGLEDVALDNLAPDLNLVVGPNESGKSRLFEALHYALFERYKGVGFGKEGLQGWHSDDPPEVEVRFVAHGQGWCLRKRLLKRQFARLEGAGSTWRDDDAEAKVRDLLGTRPFDLKPRLEHFGIWPLLWLRQGGSLEPPHQHLNDDSRAQIRDVLAAEVDQVATGPVGRHVLARAAEERDRYWTRRGQPRGALAGAQASAEQAERVLAEAIERRANAHQLSEQVAADTDALAGLAPRLAVRRAAVKQAEARLAELRELQGAVQLQEARAGRARVEAEAAERALQQHLDLAGEVDAVRERADAGRQALARAAAHLAACEGPAARETGEVVRAERIEADASRVLAHARQAREHRELSRVAVQARARVADAAAVLAELRASQAQLRDVRLDPMGVQRLREAESDVRVAGARLGAASVRVTMHAHAALALADGALAAGASRTWQVDDAHVVDVPGVLSVEVVPGEGTLAQLRDAARDATARVEQLRAELGVPDLARAEAELSRRAGLEARVQELRERLGHHAPEGVDALEQRALDAEAALRALGSGGADQLRLLADTGAAATAGGGAASLGLADAESAHEQARQALDGARRARDAAQEHLSASREAYARAEADLAGLLEQLEERERRLARLDPRPAHVEARDGAREAYAEADRKLSGLRDRFRAAGGDALPAEVDQARTALTALSAERDQLADRVDRARITLDVLGGQDLHEAVQDAEARAGEATRGLHRAQRRAHAARRLHEALEQARREAQEQLMAPVIARVRPYLAEMFPGSDLHLDPEWQVLGLRTAHTAEPFDLLSGGAREQLSVVVRLGLAEVLGAGERLPVVLDDALVNCDPGRLSAMLKVLYRASANLQVLVFSCHEVAFDGLGATKVYRLPGRRRAEIAAAV